jgi:hypothetical protein
VSGPERETPAALVADALVIEPDVSIEAPAPAVVRFAFLRGLRLAPIGGAILVILLAIGIARPVWENARYAWRKVRLGATAATTAATSAAKSVATSALSHASEASAAPVVTPAKAAPSVSPSATTGVARIESSPAGAEVLINGKRRGVTPMDVGGLKPGTYTVVVRSAEGSVRASVRIVAGEVADVLLPIFSGWVKPFASTSLQIYEHGVLIGSTDDDRIMTKPGEHDLEVVSERLGFKGTYKVEVKPGEVAALDVTLPPAPLDIEAPDGTEVWIDGKQVGTAPLGTLQVAVGTCQVLMRHQTLGERRQTTTVTYKTANRLVFGQSH